MSTLFHGKPLIGSMWCEARDLVAIDQAITGGHVAAGAGSGGSNSVK